MANTSGWKVWKEAKPTLEPLDSALSKGHGQVEGDEVLVIADHPQELKLELVQRLERRAHTQ